MSTMPDQTAPLQGMLDCPMPFYKQSDITSIPTAQPAWLERVAPEARVHQARLNTAACAPEHHAEREKHLVIAATAALRRG